MKKLISILLLGGMVLSLSGCISQKDYKDLERRVSNLEQKVGIVETSNNNQATQNNQTSNIEETTIEINNNIWSLEGMTSNEIFDECITLTKYIKTGDIQDNIISNFKVTPEYINEASFSFTNNTNCIQRIYYEAIREMNDTYTVKNTSKCTINLNISDYNLAVELYDKFYEYLKTLPYGQLDEYGYDNREGTNWESNIRYKPIEVSENDDWDTSSGNNYYYSPSFKISLSKNNDSYDMCIVLPIG